MQNFGPRVAQIDTEAVLAISSDDLDALFLKIGTGAPHEVETALVLNSVAENGLQEGREACPRDVEDCKMSQATHMLEQRGVISQGSRSAAQIVFRCKSCIDLIGLSAASSAVEVDINGTIRKDQ